MDSRDALQDRRAELGAHFDQLLVPGEGFVDVPHALELLRDGGEGFHTRRLDLQQRLVLGDGLARHLPPHEKGSEDEPGRKRVRLCCDPGLLLLPQFLQASSPSVGPDDAVYGGLPKVGLGRESHDLVQDLHASIDILFR